MNLRVVKDASRRPRMGDFSDRSLTRGAWMRGVLASRAMPAKGGCRLRSGTGGSGSQLGQGISNQSNDRAGGRGGARAGKPRWLSNCVSSQAVFAVFWSVWSHPQRRARSGRLPCSESQPPGNCRHRCSSFLRSWAAQHSSARRLKPCWSTQRTGVGRGSRVETVGSSAQHFLARPGARAQCGRKRCRPPAAEAPGGLETGVGQVGHPCSSMR